MSIPRPLTAGLALALALALPSTAIGHDAEATTCSGGKVATAALRGARAWDEASGRNLRNYPPDRQVDDEHLRLELRFDDLEVARFTAVETLTVRALGQPVESLRLDAVGFTIDSVSCDGDAVEFFHDGTELTLRLDPPLAPAQRASIEIRYTVEDPADGIFFSPTSPDRPEYTAEVHTQGETISNRHWFACHDHPGERLTTELIVDVPAGYQVSSNGHLVSHEEHGGREVWHWLQDQPHVAYLVSLVIGQFDRVEIPHDRVSMTAWVPRGLGHLVPGTYGRTGEMIDVLEERYGVPYPWDRYDQLVLKNFSAGGMENTSATSLYPTAILDDVALQDRDLESLIAHELGHQWTGDLITCRDWAHLWLNEGWATYAESIWFEHRDGDDGYYDDMRRNFRVAYRDRAGGVAMTSNIYDSPDETFRRRANPYSKGASILHMLRCQLGEDAFWAGVKLYMRRHSNQVVETHDFRTAMEETSGQALEWFFDQWCDRAGSPRIDVAVEYDAASRQLMVKVEQTQTIDENNPAFRFNLPVHVRTASGWREEVIAMTGRHGTSTITLDGPPQTVAIDPELHVLGVFSITKPWDLWTAQVDAGPTLVARHRAIGEMAVRNNAATRRLLASVIARPQLFDSLRQRAIASLAEHDDADSSALLLAAFDDLKGNNRVRASLTGAIDGSTCGDRMKDIASNDPSYTVRTAAIRQLAEHKIDGAADLLAELVHVPSQHDAIRGACLGGLSKLDDPRGLALAMKYGAYGYHDRGRGTAIGVVGALAKHDLESAVPWLIAMLDDPQSRPARAAGRALVATGSADGLEPLEQRAERHPHEAVREQAARWVTTLKEANTEE